MKNKFIYILLVSSILIVSGCAPKNTKATKTPLELQAIQLKTFEADKNTTFSSVLSVFQDLGYIVKSADKDTGFITAQSAAKNAGGFWDAFAGIARNSSTNATAFIESIGKGRAAVRLNFVVSDKSSSAYGQTSIQDNVIEDAKVYETAFNKIGDAIFIRTAAR